MAKPPRQPAAPQPRRTVKVQAVLDAEQYTRLAAGAAMRGVSHSRFVCDAIEAALREMGVFVGRRRSAGPGDHSIGTVEGSTDEAA